MAVPSRHLLPRLLAFLTGLAALAAGGPALGAGASIQARARVLQPVTIAAANENGTAVERAAGERDETWRVSSPLAAEVTATLSRVGAVAPAPRAGAERAPLSRTTAILGGPERPLLVVIPAGRPDGARASLRLDVAYTAN